MIPQLLLEQILLGEKDAKAYYEKYGKGQIEKALKDLQNSNEQILKEYPFDQIKKSFTQKSLELENSTQTQKSVKTFRFVTMAAAAIFAFAICIPVVSNVLKSNHLINSSENITRVKGKNSNHHQLRLYKKTSDSVVSLKNGEKVFENDVIQITYLPGSEKYGVIFSVDGNGNITQHFPENSWSAAELKITGEEIPLEFSYELDDAPKYECFIFVASKNKFDLSKIESLDKSLFSVEYLKKGLYLPEDCNGTMFVLNK